MRISNKFLNFLILRTGFIGDIIAFMIALVMCIRYGPSKATEMLREKVERLERELDNDGRNNDK